MLRPPCSGEARIASEDFDGAQEALLTSVKIADEIHQAFVSHIARIDLVRVYLPQRTAGTRARNDYCCAGNSPTDDSCAGAALHGIILARMDQRDEARAIFYEGLAAAERILTKTPDLYEQRYMRGLAQIGLAITTKEAADRSLHLWQALETYQGAVKNCSASGVLEKMTDLLKNLPTRQRRTFSQSAWFTRLGVKSLSAVSLIIGVHSINIKDDNEKIDTY